MCFMCCKIDSKALSSENKPSINRVLCRSQMFAPFIPVSKSTPVQSHLFIALCQQTYSISQESHGRKSSDTELNSTRLQSYDMIHNIYIFLQQLIQI